MSKAIDKASTKCYHILQGSDSVGKFIDVTGQTFGNLTVLERAENQGTRAMWKCRCSCGKECIARGSELRSGSKVDCGHSGLKRIKKAATKHGDSRSRLYRVWRSMLDRCKYANLDNSKYYHDKGITICEEWKDYTVFKQWALQNGYNSNAPFGKCTIDRKDGAKGYCPENCHFVDMVAQNKNRQEYHTHTQRITYNGVTKYVDEFAMEYNIPYKTLWARLYRSHWTVERALNTPVRNRRS